MDVLTLSRIQFGSTAAFHILWPLMSIGLGLYLFVMEAAWILSGNDAYYRQVRFWTKIFILTFAIGVASGFPLSFQFGTNWAAFASAAGSFFGNILGFETTIAFTLESASLGLFVFGWGKVSRPVHLAANFLVLLGASLSAFWIMVANGWMQAPIGTHFANGVFVVDDYFHAIINSETLVSSAHMWIACVESTLFLMGGIAAASLLRRDLAPGARDFFARTFRYALVLAVVCTPIQVVLGDLSGLTVAAYQPEKLASLEMNWQTNTFGTSASWSLLAWPNSTGTGDSFNIAIPGALSLLTTHSLTGQVRGLNSFPPDDRPTAGEDIVTFYAFRVMVAIGFILLFLAFATAWAWYYGELSVDRISAQRRLLAAWVAAAPLGFIATEAGWMVREIGRQPWVVYHALRTSDALSSGLNAPVVSSVLALIIVTYAVLIVLFAYFSWRIVRAGPDLTSPIPRI